LFECADPRPRARFCLACRAARRAGRASGRRQGSNVEMLVMAPAARWRALETLVVLLGEERMRRYVAVWCADWPEAERFVAERFGVAA
jgi:hypothetical protein